MSRGRRIDLHVHSLHSPDGRSTVDELVAGAVARGLDGLALTDHNTVAGHARLAELARQRPELSLISGVEVSASEGHLLAYGVPEPPPPHRPVDATITWVADHGGVAVLAHPFRRVHGVGRAVARSAAVPALETVNAHNRPSANDRARTLAVARALGATGGSDAHQAREVGGAWTEFPEGATSPGELIEALRRGRTVAGGDALEPSERVRLALRSLWLRIGRGLRPV